MHPLSSARGASEALRHEVEYDPTLSGAELIAAVRALLAAKRHTEQLICRYLADLADRVHERRDDWLGARIQSPDGPTTCEPVEDIARRHLGLGRRTTRERIRVGRALRTLPQLEQAFIDGDLSYSRVREVTRIATDTTEVVWLELARTLDMRALEGRVAQAKGAMGTGDVELNSVDPGEPSSVWLGGHAENDTAQKSNASSAAGHPDLGEARNAIGAGSHDATGAGARENMPHAGAFGADERDHESSDRCARANALVEWTSPTTVRVTLDLTAAAWALLKPAVHAALSKRSAVSDAVETPDTATPAALQPGPIEGSEGPLAEPPGAAETMQVGVEPARVNVGPTRAEPPRAIEWQHTTQDVGERRTPLGIPQQGTKGATHLGTSERHATGAVGARHAPPDPTSQVSRLPSVASANGDETEWNPTRAPLPGTGYAPAARVLEVMAKGASWSVDSLVEASGLLVQQVNAALTFLSLEGYVRQRAGEFVRR
jgi:DprA/Smf-like nucleotide binding protein involved in DNA uptake